MDNFEIKYAIRNVRAWNCFKNFTSIEKNIFKYVERIKE